MTLFVYIVQSSYMSKINPLVAKERREAIETIEMHDQGLSDTLAIMADPELQNLLKASEKEIKTGKLILLDEV